MAININDLKQMKEDECYIKTKQGETIKKIIALLKEKPKSAFTCAEITKMINEQYKSDFVTSSVASSLNSRIKVDNTEIKKKGSYYWYEKS